MSIGFTEILLIVLLALLLFGARRLPDLARSLGRAVKEFKQGIAELDGKASPPDTKDPADPPSDKPQA